jgi:hypothetical protein
VPARMQLENRRHSLSDSISLEITETAILREGREIASLAEGDPLRYALELSVHELQSLRRALRPILDREPRVKRVLEAIIEYKEQAALSSSPMCERSAI